jgi:hypothetical protein
MQDFLNLIYALTWLSSSVMIAVRRTTKTAISLTDLPKSKARRSLQKIARSFSLERCQNLKEKNPREITLH